MVSYNWLLVSYPRFRDASIFNDSPIEWASFSTAKCSYSDWERVLETKSYRGIVGYIVVFWPSTRPKMSVKVMHRKEVTHSSGSYERKSRGRKLADEMGRGKKKIPWYTQTDAPEESDLWTAWQLFPLDDDQTCDFKDWVGDWVGVQLLYNSVKTEVKFEFQFQLETEL